jgi:hypothetical protein
MASVPVTETSYSKIEEIAVDDDISQVIRLLTWQQVLTITNKTFQLRYHTAANLRGH